MKSRAIATALGVLMMFCISVPVTFGAEPGAKNRTAIRSENALIVYYFHGKRRCTTCKKLEAYAREALEKSFSGEVRDGRIEWRITDISTPENSHFVKDFGLVSQSLVLVRQEAGKQGGWKNLDQIWMKVRDKEDYIDYVSENIRQFMGKNG
ncbi:hypothetical protein DENIS_0953 [Desulfonema ishimotonii]|uniref:Thioredoxin n=1 Tax=Desulfonema ishimotonii TaxID=45657 RepID=A0A401FSR2_9BACT|nr:nitrophenyl compound nitroreductase subunit ArsF family protein [Desulfonema ishimotonii]GBC60011.1 hypothetical protein DENIS_0953 [Desulfonema ishimotonii]